MKIEDCDVGYVVKHNETNEKFVVIEYGEEEGGCYDWICIIPLNEYIENINKEVYNDDLNITVLCDDWDFGAHDGKDYTIVEKETCFVKSNTVYKFGKM